MNNIELQANLVRGTNLSKLYEVCQNQQTINTSRLEKLLDEVWEQQKRWVRNTRSSNDDRR